MTVPTASSPTRDPPPPSTSSGTVTTEQEREGLDHHHLPSPLPPGWPLQAELFLGNIQHIKSSSSSSESSKKYKIVKGGKLKLNSKIEIEKHLSRSMASSSSSPEHQKDQ